VLYYIRITLRYSTCYTKLIRRLFYRAKNIAIVANYAFPDSQRSFVIFTENQFRSRAEMSLSPPPSLSLSLSSRFVREYPEQTLSLLLREREIWCRESVALILYISFSFVHCVSERRRRENLEIAHFRATIALKNYKAS